MDCFGKGTVQAFQLFLTLTLERLSHRQFDVLYETGHGFAIEPGRQRLPPIRAVVRSVITNEREKAEKLVPM
jgi:hypothetical protein